MTTTHGLQCFEIDLEDTWCPLDETEFDATSDTFAFYNPIGDVRLFIFGERIDPGLRDLLDLALGMNRAAVAGLERVADRLGGALWVDGATGIGETLTSCDVDVVAEVAGPAGVRQRMLVATVVNSVVAIYLRLESATLTGDALRTLWRNLRPNLFLAEPVQPDG